MAPIRTTGSRIGLVPTMGALHQGHLSLIRQARNVCDFVVVSIFVNPTQFGPAEDLDKYPRPLDDDLFLCKNEGVDLVFVPEKNEIYPEHSYIRFQIDSLADHLCGASRPGHFNGVLQVVNKLFNIVRPDDAFFGQKDIQQFAIISAMVREFNIPVNLHRVATIREPDGLALSSRNRYLSDDERKIAPELYKTLENLAAHLESGIPKEHLKSLLAAERSRLTAIGFKNDYLEVVDFKTLQPVDDVKIGNRYIIALAAFLGNTRLIDNIIIYLDK